MVTLAELAIQAARAWTEQCERLVSAELTAEGFEVPTDTEALRTFYEARAAEGWLLTETTTPFPEGHRIARLMRPDLSFTPGRVEMRQTPLGFTFVCRHR